MTLRLWEVAVAAVMLALVVLFFVSGDPEGGFVLLALVLLGLPRERESSSGRSPAVTLGPAA